MGLISLFSSKTKGHAEELAVTLTKDIPPKLLQNSAQVLSANRVTTILERCYNKAADIQHDNNYGFVSRAIFANTFRWKLRELGYTEEFVSIATEGLLIHLSKAKNKLP